jgi:hypothetical protein
MNYWEDYHLNKKILVALTVITISCVIIIGVYLFFELDSIDDFVEPEPLPEIDDRISPLTNQGLIFEVNRIIDDIEFNSREVTSATAENDEPFNMWDTMFLENKMSVDVDEEQDKSRITLTIYEEIKSGLFGLRTNQVKRDYIRLTYDYRTGRWSDDDSFNDYDGYGHYLGEYFEIWFNIYQTDFDEDGIPYWTEVNLIGTDPYADDTYLDPDNDGIPTSWEWKWGYDPHIWDDHTNLDPDIDGIENIEEYQMSKWFANPFSQDIYIEADGMERGGLFDPPHILWEESQQIVIERFAEHNINLYFDFGWTDGPSNGGGELLTHHRTISSDLGTIWQYYNHHFADERKGIFRYFIVAHSSGYATASQYNRFDCFSVETSKQIMWGKLARHAFTPRAQRLLLASSILHETGHTLGILPWTVEGCDNMSFANGIQAKRDFLDKWGDYHSAMNYYYIWDRKLIDYSDGSNGPPYDQDDWMELYLPTFQYEGVVVEDPTFHTPGTDLMVVENESFKLKGWIYSYNLTEKFNDYIDDWSPIDPIKCNYSVYVKIDNSSTPSDRDIRIYAQPIFTSTIVPPAQLTLLFECYLNEDGSIDLDGLIHR